MNLKFLMLIREIREGVVNRKFFVLPPGFENFPKSKSFHKEVGVFSAAWIVYI